MSEAGFVELPVLRWLSGHGSARPGDKGLGWTYRGEADMAAFGRPLEDPLVEKLLVDAILRINAHVGTPAQARLAVNALRKTMDAADKLTAKALNFDENIREEALIDWEALKAKLHVPKGQRRDQPDKQPVMTGWLLL